MVRSALLDCGMFRWIPLYVSLRHPFRISFRNGVVSGVGMGTSGFPSLLALSALVGFVVLQAVLAFGT